MTRILAGWQRGAVTAPRTLAQMAQNIRAALKQPIAWETAKHVIARVAERDQPAQARAIRAWAKNHFRYVADPLHVELLDTPVYLLQHIRRDAFVQGDCDDATTLTATLLAAVGIPAVIQAVAFDRPNAPYSHVFTTALPAGGAPVNMDVSHPDNAPPRMITRRITARI